MRSKSFIVQFQSRSQSLIKQIHDLYEQIEQTHVELRTFVDLRQHEIGAIPKRKEVSDDYITCMS